MMFQLSDTQKNLLFYKHKKYNYRKKLVLSIVVRINTQLDLINYIIWFCLKAVLDTADWSKKFIGLTMMFILFY